MSFVPRRSAWQFGIRMVEVCSSWDNLLVGHPPSPCFTNKTKGLRRTEVLQTSRFDLVADLSDGIPFATSFISSTSEYESSSPSKDPDPNNCVCMFLEKGEIRLLKGR